MHMLLLQKRKGGLVLCPAVVSDEDGKASRLRLVFHVNVMEFQQLRGDFKADFPFFFRLKPQLLKPRSSRTGLTTRPASSRI